jgi:class 3 adenylate cyclase
MNVAARLCDHRGAAEEALLVSGDLLRSTAASPELAVGTGESLTLRERQAAVETYPMRRTTQANDRLCRHRLERGEYSG